MPVCRVTENPPPRITFNTGAVDRVTSSKLFGLTTTDNLSWEDRVNAVCVEAGFNLHFLNVLIKFLSVTLNFDDLLHHFKSVIRPAIEYACPVCKRQINVVDVSRFNGEHLFRFNKLRT